MGFLVDRLAQLHTSLLEHRKFREDAFRASDVLLVDDRGHSRVNLTMDDYEYVEVADLTMRRC